VIINGTVIGPVECDDLLELQPKARIQGDVRYGRIEMHQGAAIDGEVRTIKPSEERPALKLAASSRL
jgi:cytoskeletal protein CcmA (bactofilin family)